MARTVQKVETKGVIMALLSLVLISTGCEDKIDTSAGNPSEGKTVEVMLNLGIADEEGGTGETSPTCKSVIGNSWSAFDVVPVACVHTKATTDKPDQLYNFEIWQYNANGDYMGGQALSTVAIGSALTVNLTKATGCQLLLIARGALADFSSLSGKSLSQVQALIVQATTSKINAIATDANGSGLANMTYYLYLKNVNISSTGKIQSTEGSDVRLLLKRLAVKLTLDWTFSPSMTQEGYILKEVKLCQVPAHYRLIPQAEQTDKWGEVYPTSVAEYVDYYRLKDNELTNSTKTVWMPANARGISVYATTPLYRNKNNANAAATYAEFVVDNSTKNIRLYYRAYLGGNETNDFNLLENTNYHWTVNITRNNYVNDPRIQLLDQTPVLSDNLQTTANCFMMRPGTNISFNPYKHEAGVDGWNTYLTSGGAIRSGKDITKVEVLWQTKDAGTSGDLVLGYVADATNHQNLVNLTNGTDINNARIHVKVPNTNGGNAVIAAKNSSGAIVWSWHIWISDYVPATLTGDITTVSRSPAIEAAQNATRNGMVHVYGGISWTDPNGSFYKCVIMDRNLGATRGGLQNNAIDWVRTFGLLYQGGRKDPIFGTADGSTDEARTIYDGDGNVLSLTKRTSTSPSLDQSIQNPLTFFSDGTNNWGGDASKTIYDPCPKGWRVPSNEYLNNGASGGISLSSGWGGFVYTKADSRASLCAGFGRTETDFVCEWNQTKKNSNNIMYYDGSKFNTLTGQGYGESSPSAANTDAFKGTNGAGYLYFGGSGEDENNWTNKSAFFPTAVLREKGSGNFRANSNNKLFLWSSSSNKNGNMQMYEFQSGLLSFQHVNPSGYGFSVRCIQDNIKDRSYSDYQSGN